MRAIIRSRDIANAGAFLILLPVAWLLPVRFWPSFTRGLAGLHVRLIGKRAMHLDGMLRDQVGISAAELEIRFRQHNCWELLELLRDHAPWGWNPRITVVGEQFIDEALKKGKGVVLWYTAFTHADLVFKKGLWQAGYRINHLSSLTHGFSDTRFGVTFLNPVKTCAERRYLKERCVMAGGNVGAVIRALLERLRHNEIVSVTALQSGKRTSEREMFGGTIRLAKGAPNMALTTGAALIPVFVVPMRGGYQVRIEPPLSASSTEIEAAEEECISAYVPLLERYVRIFPGLWRGWFGSPNYWTTDTRLASKKKAMVEAA